MYRVEIKASIFNPDGEEIITDTHVVCLSSLFTNSDLLSEMIILTNKYRRDDKESTRQLLDLAKDVIWNMSEEERNQFTEWWKGS